MAGSHRSSNHGRLIAIYPRKISRFRFCPYSEQFIRSIVRKAWIDCTGRLRRIPIIFDEFICLTMTTNDACIACVNPPRNPSESEQTYNTEREIFIRKYEAMDKEDLAACFTVKLDDVITTFGELFKCVFCYKAFGILLRDLNKLKLNWPDFYKFQDHPDSLACLTPFVIGDKEIYIDPKHLPRCKSMSDLFCVRMPQLYSEIFREVKGASPCEIHDNSATNYLAQLQVWSDAWKVLESPARRAVLEIPYALLVGTISSFLNRHLMCEDCEVNVYRSLLYLFALRGQELSPEELKDGNPSTFDCIIICKRAKLPFTYKTFSKKDLGFFKNFLSSTYDFHVHIEESEKYVRQLMFLINPEVDSKMPMERRTAANLMGGQSCLVLCFGLILFKRFQCIWEKFNETKSSVNVLSYTLLTLMRTAFENSYEQTKGLEELDRICREIELEETKKESKSAKKRARKKRNKKNQAANQSNPQNDENDLNAVNVDAATNRKKDSPSKNEENDLNVANVDTETHQKKESPSKNEENDLNVINVDAETHQKKESPSKNEENDLNVVNVDAATHQKKESPSKNEENDLNSADEATHRKKESPSKNEEKDTVDTVTNEKKDSPSKNEEDVECEEVYEDENEVISTPSDLPSQEVEEVPDHMEEEKDENTNTDDHPQEDANPPSPVEDPFIESFQSFSILSLNESMDDAAVGSDDDGNDKEGIPEEDIKNFQKRLPDVLLKREELRQCLKSRFEELCKTVTKNDEHS